MTPQEILSFWFPGDLGDDRNEILRQVQWWFRGGSSEEVRTRFEDTLHAAEAGELDAWKESTDGRLALIIVLDQFSRAVYAGSPQMYANDPAARALAREGLGNGDYSRLSSPWEKTFFSLPFGHSEDLEDIGLAVKMAEELRDQAREPLRSILEFSANQARGHYEVVARFGRHPHRNDLLGRKSTAAEARYLAEGTLVHQRDLPSRK